MPDRRQVNLRILGPLGLSDAEGTEFCRVLAQPKRLALLAFLALAGSGGFRRRDTVVALFWPDYDQSRARAALRQALSWLRHELGVEVFITRGDEEVGAGEVLHCDAVQFEEACGSGHWDRALELYRGELLAGVFVAGAAPELERWLDEERVRLRDRATDAAWRRADRASSEGRAHEAAEWGRRAAGLAPHDEGGVRHLIRLLVDAGDRAGALEVYARFRERLRTEFDAEPAAETEHLMAKVRLSARRLRETPWPQGLVESVVPASPILPETPGPPQAAVVRERRSRSALVLSAVFLAALATGSRALRRSDEPPGDSRAVAPKGRPIAENMPSLVPLGAARPPGNLAHRPNADLGAYRLLLEAEHYIGKRSAAGFRQARDLALQAIDRDPLYADAYAVLSQCYQGYAWYGVTPANDAFLKAESAALRAVALDPASGIGHAALGATLSFFRYRWAEGEEEFRRAIALDPANAEIRNLYSIHLRVQGQFPEALAEMRQAQALDPLFVHYFKSAGQILVAAGRDEEAVPELRKALDLDSTFVSARELLSDALARLGRYDEALREWQTALRLRGNDTSAAIVASARGKAGYEQAALKVAGMRYQSLQQEGASGQFVRSVDRANALLDLGNREQAIVELERAFEVHDPRLLNLAHAAAYRGIQQDSRVQSLERRMKLRQ